MRVHPFAPLDDGQQHLAKHDLATVTLGVLRSRFFWLPVALAALLYFVVASVGLSSLEDDLSWGDALYTSVVIASTVGYGDFTPKKDGSKLFVVFLVHFALLIVGTIISSSVTGAVEALMEKLKGRSAGGKIGLFDAAAKRKARIRRLVRFFLLYLLCICTGTVYFWISDDLEEREGSKWLNALYMSVITLSTIGFGDLLPTTDGGKVFVCVFQLVGIPVFATAVGVASSAVLGEAQDQLTLMKVKGLDTSKFKRMAEFSEELIAAGVSHRHEEGKVTRFEFLCFMLVENGVVETRNLINVCHNFAELDKDGTGYIGYEDVDLWINGGAVPGTPEAVVAQDTPSVSPNPVTEADGCLT